MSMPNGEALSEREKNKERILGYIENPCMERKVHRTCPIPLEECKNLTNIVFDVCARRKDAEGIFTLYKYLHPHIEIIPECLEIDLSNSIYPIKNFCSYNGIYSPPLLFDTNTLLVCEYIPENLCEDAWLDNCCKVTDNKHFFKFNMWVWRRNEITSETDDIFHHLRVAEDILTKTSHYRQFNHFFIIMVKHDSNLKSNDILRNKITDRYTRTVIVAWEDVVEEP